MPANIAAWRLTPTKRWAAARSAAVSPWWRPAPACSRYSSLEPTTCSATTAAFLVANGGPASFGFTGRASRTAAHHLTAVESNPPLPRPRLPPVG